MCACGHESKKSKNTQGIREREKERERKREGEREGGGKRVERDCVLDYERESQLRGHWVAHNSMSKSPKEV